MIDAKQDPTCASIGRIGAKEPRDRSFALTVAKSKVIYAKCVVTATSSGRIDAIYVATFVICGETGAMRAGTKNKREKGKGEGVKESDLNEHPGPFPLTRSPFPLFPSYPVLIS